MEQVNGLPVSFFVIAGGIIVILTSWLIMRFGRTIAKAILTIAGVCIGLVIALAVLAQGAASLSTAQVAQQTAKVAQTASTSNLILVGAVGCIGGVSLVAVVVALGVAGYFWLKSKQTEKAQKHLPQRYSQPALSETQNQPVVWVVGDGQQSGVNLENVDLSQWGW